MIFVGDRGMHITYNMENDPDLSDEDIHFITGLTHSQIQTLITEGTLQLSFFSSEPAEVVVDDKRYILSVNPDLEWKERAYLDNRRYHRDAMTDEIRKAWKKRCDKNEENRKNQEEHRKIRKIQKPENRIKR